MKIEDQAALVGEMLDASRLPDDAVDRLLDHALDADYWRRLCPGLGVEAAGRTGICDSRSLADDELARLLERFRREGYFHAEPLLPAVLMQQMRDCVERLRAARWPPVFAFVFDEFWTALRTASVDRLLSAGIGAGYRQTSVLWTYYVAAHDGASGWTPHADGDGDHRLTVWIPLTDATIDNGCMYLIPRTQVPRSLPPDYRQWKIVERSELERLLQGTRSVPTPAGSLLGWNHDIVHWGSIASGATAPRISIAVQFIAADAKPTPWECPILGDGELPSLTERLYTIGKRLAAYRKFEPLMIQYGQFAEKLMATCKGAATESW